MRRILLIAAGILVLLVLGLGAVGYWQASSIVAELHAGPKEAVVRAVEPELHRQPRRRLVAVAPEPSAQTILLIGTSRSPVTATTGSTWPSTGAASAC